MGEEYKTIVEQAILQRLIEIRDIYHIFNPEGKYLTMSIIDDTIMISNEHYEGGADADNPIDVFASPERVQEIKRLNSQEVLRQMLEKRR